MSEVVLKKARKYALNVGYKGSQILSPPQINVLPSNAVFNETLISKLNSKIYKFENSNSFIIDIADMPIFKLTFRDAYENSVLNADQYWDLKLKLTNNELNLAQQWIYFLPNSDNTFKISENNKTFWQNLVPNKNIN